VLSSQRSYQEIELGQHAPDGAKLLEKFGKLSGGLFVCWPQA
jgi:hypothetical protein